MLFSLSTKKLVVYLSAAVALVPVMVAIRFTHKYGCNTLLYDDFGLCWPLFKAMFAGNFDWYHLLQTFNGHPYVFAKVIILVFGLMTDFNSLAQMYLSIFMMFGILLCLMLVNFRSVGKVNTAVFLSIINSLLIFSLRNYESYLYGVVFANSMAILLFAISIFSLAKAVRFGGPTNSGPFVCALLCGVISTGSGTVATISVWPLGVLLILYGFALELNQLVRQKLKTMFIVWISTAFATLIFSFWYPSNVYSTIAIEPFNFDKLLKMGHYGILLTGSTIFGDQTSAYFAGLLLLALTVCVSLVLSRELLQKKLDVKLMPALCLMSFGILSLLMITIGRGRVFELSQSMSPRYQEFGAIGICGMLACLAGLDKWRKTRITLIAILSLLILIGYFVALKRSAAIGAYLLEERLRMAYLLKTYKIQSDSSLKALGSTFLVRRLAPMLESHRYNVFAEAQATVPSIQRGPLLTKCYAIDRFGAENSPKASSIILPVGTGESIQISGWAFIPEKTLPAKNVFVRIAGFEDIPAQYGLPRNDVAMVFKNKDVIRSGFWASFSGGILAVGIHPVSLLVVDNDGSKAMETPPIGSIQIRNENLND